MSTLLCYIFLMHKFSNTILTITLSVAALLLCSLCSCATRVGVNMLVPAKTNLGGNTVIAVSSTAVKQYSLQSAEAAAYATKITEAALNQGVYNVIGTDITDSIIRSAKKLGYDPTDELIRRGASVLVQTSIDYIGYYDEYNEEFFKDRDGIMRVKVKVQRVAELSLSCTVWDLKSRTILDSFVLSDSDTSNEKEVSYGGLYHNHGEVYFDTATLYKNIIHRFKNKIRDRLVPHFDTFKVKLIQEKDKSDELKAAYDYAKDGQYRSALVIFENGWNRNVNPVCGYNAAVLYYALGEYDKAIELAESVFEKTGNPDTVALIEYFENLVEMQNNAIAQIEGTAPVSTPKQEIRYW